VDIQPAYDRHRDLLTLPRASTRPHAKLVTQPMLKRLSWGGPPEVPPGQSDRMPAQSANGSRSRCMASYGRLCGHGRQNRQLCRSKRSVWPILRRGRLSSRPVALRLSELGRNATGRWLACQRV
jgi:hypothetical protein